MAEGQELETRPAQEVEANGGESTTPRNAADAPHADESASTAKVDKRLKRQDENIARLQQTLGRRADLAENRARELEAELHRVRMSQLPVDQQEVYQRDLHIRQLQNQLQANEAELRSIRQDSQLNRALGRISTATGVTMEDLRDKFEELGDPDEVWDWAVKRQARQAQRQERETEREQKVRANATDVGSGRTSTTLSEWERKYEAAKGNSVEQIRLLRLKPRQ